MQIFYRYVKPIGLEKCQMPDSRNIVGKKAKIVGMGNTDLDSDALSPGLMAAEVRIEQDAGKLVLGLI